MGDAIAPVSISFISVWVKSNSVLKPPDYFSFAWSSAVYFPDGKITAQ